MAEGKVFLVGAGPGDPELMTVKGIRCLQQAQVVIYDRLVNDAIMQVVPGDAEKIYVGKESGKHTMGQEGINALLVQKALAGKRVVRLKGGDPFVFGRGGEEALALLVSNIPFEVVPGITSAIAAPAYAGIPVTHRGLASSFHVITGHEDNIKETSALNWEHIAGLEGTLLFMMGVANAGTISHKLQQYGQSRVRPVAVVQWGTTFRQRVLNTTLGTLEEDIKINGITSPAVILVGEVASLRHQLQWFEKLPLWGKRIIVTRAREQAGRLARELRAMGADVFEYPTIRIKLLDNDALLNEELGRINRCSWMIFTSRNGGESLFSRLAERHFDIRNLAGIKLCTIGAATEAALKERGLQVDYVPSVYEGEAVAGGLKARLRSEENVLLIKALETRDVVEQELRSAGIELRILPVYQTLLGEGDSDALKAWLKQGAPNWVTFTSASTVRNFISLTQAAGTLDKAAVKAACIGPVTAQAAEDYGLNIDVLAREYTIPGLVEAMIEHAAKMKQKKDAEKGE